MLSEVFIRKIVKDAIDKYKCENKGIPGASKSDIIEHVMKYGGDTEDVRAAMNECIKILIPNQYHDLFI